MNDEELDALVERLDNLFAMLEEEGYYTKANTADFARKAITTIRTQLAEVKAELGNANKIMDDWTTLHRVIADIRDASGLGSRPMLSDLAAEIGRSLAEANSRADRAEAERAAQIDVDAELVRSMDNGRSDDEWLDYNLALLRAFDKIRRQPHDRTALDRMLAEAREKALREAADMFDADSNIAQTILALIEADHAQP